MRFLRYPDPERPKVSLSRNVHELQPSRLAYYVELAHRINFDLGPKLSSKKLSVPYTGVYQGRVSRVRPVLRVNQGERAILSLPSADHDVQ